MSNETPCRRSVEAEAAGVVEAVVAAAVATHTTEYFAIVNYVTEDGPKTFAETVHLDTKLKATERCRAVVSAIPECSGMKAVVYSSVEPNRLSRAGEAFEAYVFAVYVTEDLDKDVPEDKGIRFYNDRSTNSGSSRKETIPGRASRMDAPGGATREMLYQGFTSGVPDKIKTVISFKIVSSKI
ncbi:hypothetical protein ACQPZP_02110 [Spirillospora sp. CA-142024]|uniref:hypothetical protein n=1 Tax=Spirillospora sp. CA-142024 TaxID=3240036 RepID=UPI003D9023D6